MSFREDLRDGGRALLAKPALTGAIVLTLAAAVGFNTASFTVVDAVLLRPLPYPESEQLVTIAGQRPARGPDHLAVSPPNFHDWRERSTVFDSIAAYSTGEFNLVGSGEPTRVAGAEVSSAFFSTLRVAAESGRTFSADEEGAKAPPVAVLGYELARLLFGSDRGPVGSRVLVNGQSYTVIGVTPSGFRFPAGSQLWVPLAVDPDPALRAAHFLEVVARLAPGKTLRDSQQQMSTIASGLERDYPEANAGRTAVVVPLKMQIVGDVRPVLLVIWAAVWLLLVIACANVTTLLLTRLPEREREMAIRSALGASPGRLARRVVIEAVLLAGAAGAAAVIIAVLILEPLRSSLLADLPRADTVGVNLRTFAFAAVLSLGCALAVGVVPIVRARYPDSRRLLPTARGSDVRGRRRRAALVAVEVALGTLLLIGAALLGRSFANLRAVPTGVDLDKVVTLQLTLPRSTYERPEQVTAFYHALVQRVRTIPGVADAAAADTLPLAGSSNRTSFSPRGSEVKEAAATDLIAGYTAVTEGYFEALRIGRRGGRLFDDRDRRDGVRSAIVNETLARQFWPGGDAVGRSLVLGLQMAERRHLLPAVLEARAQVPFGAGRDLLQEGFVHRPAFLPELLHEPGRGAALDRTDKRVDLRR